jgi:tetratricopeptide (TPR) repeat protein
MLDERGASRPVRTLARRAEHLVAAGELAAAVAPLSRAVQIALRRMEIQTAASLNARQRDLLDTMSLASDEPRRMHNGLDHAEILSILDLEKAGDVLERLRPGFERAGEPDCLVRLWLAAAKLALQQGKLEEGRHALNQAQSYADHVAPELRARVERGKGHAARFVGDYESALEHFERARDLYEQSRFPSPALQVESDIIFVHTERGDFEFAWQRALPLLEEARRQGDAHAEVQFLNCLGDVAQHLGDWENACRYFSQGLEADRRTGNRIGESIQLLNLGLSEVGMNCFDAALGHFRQAKTLFDDHGISRLKSLLVAGLVACAAGMADWRRVDEQVERLDEILSATDFRTSNQAWALHLAAQKVREAGDIERTRRIEALEQVIRRDLKG